MIVSETFFSIEVVDMQRASTFYARAFGATVMFASDRWTSLQIAGVRIGLFHYPEYAASRVGLHFVVDDLEQACDEIERAGGHVVNRGTQVAPGVTIADVTDTEGNTFSLRQDS